jgi:hypothetical protein
LEPNLKCVCNIFSLFFLIYAILNFFGKYFEISSSKLFDVGYHILEVKSIKNGCDSPDFEALKSAGQHQAYVLLTSQHVFEYLSFSTFLFLTTFLGLLQINVV